MRVERVGLAPVKGMRHEAVPSVRVDADGVVGDRAVALVDAEARATLKSAEHGTLVRLRGSVGDGRVTVTLPDGTRHEQGLDGGEPVRVSYWGRPVDARLVDGPVAGALSDLLGRRVLLAPAPARRAFVWDAPVSVVLRSELDELARRAGRADLADPALLGRYRANVVLDDRDDPLHAAVGTCLTCGDVVLEVAGEIDRCAVMDHHPTTGATDAPVMRTLATYRREPGGVMLGLRARVVRPGTLTTGTPCTAGTTGG